MIARRRYAARYRQITRTLIAHGFGGLIVPLGLRVRDRFSTAQAPVDGTEEPLTEPAVGRSSITPPMHLRLALAELGPTFIKLGQILSTRADLLPPEYIAELVKLQDRVPPADFPQIAEVIETELGLPLSAIFASIDPRPLAAASIGQVHAARLIDGTDVVVKVQRPGVEQTINEDLAILTDLAGLAARRLKIAQQQDFPALVAEFSWTLRAELDYEREANNAARFARIFEDDRMVLIPRVYWAQSSRRVLTLQRIHGIRIDDVAGLAAVGVDRCELAERAAQMVLREIFEVGFFHADPHPGNFLVQPNGAIGTLDFGMVGTLDERLRERLLMLLIGVVERDVGRIADDLIGLGAAGPDLNRELLQRDLRHLLSQYYGRTLGDLSIPRLIEDVMEVVQRHALHMPTELALLAKTLMMNEALGRLLDPSFDAAAVAEPYVQGAMRELYSPGFWWQKLKLRPLETMLLAATLPSHLQRLLDRIERDELGFHIHFDELPQMLSEINGMVNRMALAILIASAAIGLAILYQAMKPALASWLGGFFVAAFSILTLVGLVLIAAIWRSGR